MSPRLGPISSKRDAPKGRWHIVTARPHGLPNGGPMLGFAHMETLCLQSAPAGAFGALTLRRWIPALGLLAACGGANPSQPQGTGTSASTSTSRQTTSRASSTQSRSSANSTSQAGQTSTTDSTTTSSGPGLQTITIQFKGMLGKQPFSCGQVYDGLGTDPSVRIEPMDFRFYVHNLRLVNEQGQEVPLRLDDRDPWQGSQIALIDFEDSQGACGNSGDPGVNAQVTGSLPAGRYRGIKFSNSVPAKLNHANPTSLGAPLHAGGMTWGWLSGYKFFAAELRQTNAAEGANPGSALFHIGSQVCDAGPDGISCSKSNRNEIVLPSFEPETHQVVVNLAPIFSQANFNKESPCHSATEVCDPMFKAVGVNFKTGLSQTEQTTFSIEAKVGASAR